MTPKFRDVLPAFRLAKGVSQGVVAFATKEQKEREARILNLLHQKSGRISQLQKPQKIYFENSNFARSFQSEPNKRTIRKTFFAGQIINAGLPITLHSKADFKIDESYVIEVGGRNKTLRQIKGEKDAYLAKDDIEHGFSQTVPLWLFGFLY